MNRPSGRLTLIVGLPVVLGFSVAAAFGWQWWVRSVTTETAAACQAAIQSDRWDEARILADRWVRRAPADADAWFSLAEVARSQGDLAATAESLRRVPPSDRRYLKAQALRGDLLLDGLRKPAEAIVAWQDMLRQSPGAEVAHQRLIYVYAMTLQRNRMVEQIRQAIRHRAEPPEAYGYLLAAPNLVFSDGYHRVGQWLAESPDDETLRVAHAIFAARTNPSKGVKMFGSVDAQAGDLSLIRQCLLDDPENVEVLAFFIDRAIFDGDLEEAGRLLQTLPASAEQDSRFWRYLGTWRDSQKQTAAAAEAFRQSISLHPMSWRSHFELAAVERTLGRAEEAAKHAELGARGKLLERQILELPNAAQADRKLLLALWEFARDCGDHQAADGLGYRLGIPAGRP